ncbi:30S ribosomal protein S21 [Patescibacteria group bacterium]|nr:30S ribosomal protein S21 [Patescibacteria group bacterium]
MSVIDIKRKKGESFEAMFRRFSRRLQSSGKVLNVRADLFHHKSPGKNKTHESALRRLEIGAKREWLIRTGQLKENEWKRR